MKRTKRPRPNPCKRHRRARCTAKRHRRGCYLYTKPTEAESLDSIAQSLATVVVVGAIWLAGRVENLPREGESE